MRYEPISPQLFQHNRQRFMRKMQPDSIAIFPSSDRMPRTGDTFFPFRQDSALFYLSGLDQDGVVLMLFPDCIKEGFQEVAFIQRANKFTEIYEGEKLAKERASAISGIERIYWLDEMGHILHELILLAKRIYLNLNEHDRYRSEVMTRQLRFAKELKERYPLHKYHRAQPILKKLFMIKAPMEVELIRRSVNITGQAFERVLRFLRPGIMEYEIEAEITHEFIRNGANGHAYDPIVASGKNTCILHYVQNNQRCREGDLLLLDFGAEYANYAADVSRTVPVSGRFSARQRAVYDAVLRCLKGARQLLLPGTTIEEYHREVGRMVEGELLQLGLLDKTDLKKQSEEQPAYKRYFMHGTSHHIGLDVHDASNRYAPLQAGMIFTCEPGIYIREEGLGVRLENNILVTDEGPVDLTANIPIEPEAIEEQMQAEVLSST